MFYERKAKHTREQDTIGQSVHGGSLLQPNVIEQH